MCRNNRGGPARAKGRELVPSSIFLQEAGRGTGGFGQSGELSGGGSFSSGTRDQSPKEARVGDAKSGGADT